VKGVNLSKWNQQVGMERAVDGTAQG
jgi:hypothetical protein